MGTMATLAIVAVSISAFIVERYLRSPRIIVLGREVAAAAAAERLRLQRPTLGPSPLATTTYDVWKGELQLWNPQPVPLDSALSAVVRSLAAAPADVRAQARGRISMEQFYTLLNFSQRAAVIGLREKNVERVRDGLAAVALIERARIDDRNIPLVLSLLYHATVRIGADADALFSASAALAEPAVSQTIRQFAASAPEVKSLRDAWGFSEVQTSAGIGIIGWGFTEYQPTTNLAALVLEMAEVVERDQYLAVSVEIATVLPDVWLLAGQVRTIPEIRTVRGGARIRGELRPGAHQPDGSQHLLIFVVELPNEEAVRGLIKSTHTLQPKNYSLLAISRGRLFSIVVGASFVDGVPAYETAERLGRFRAAIDAILVRYVD